MIPVHIFGIKTEQPYKQIYMRLGYNNYLTELDESQKNKIDGVISKGISCCELSGVFINQNILKNDGEQIGFSSGNIKSRDLSGFLEPYDEVFITGVTAGKMIIKLRNDCINKDDIFNSVIFDAVGSEMAEACIDWIHNFIAKKIRIEGKQTGKRRFSPGYGDFGLSNQNFIFNLLEMQKIGVELNSGYILDPEKSITAIIPVTRG